MFDDDAADGIRVRHAALSDDCAYPAGMLRFRLPRTRNHLLRAAGLIVGVVAAGTFGYGLFGLTPVDAFYQTIITISTVGFRELTVGEPDAAWKLFTAVLILVGTGSMLYGATAVIESIVEGRITGQFRRYRMQRSIDELSGHLVVCGLGRVGTSITDFVQSIGQEVVAVDVDPDRLEGAGLLHVVGDSRQEDVLRQAGIDRATTLITALGTTVDNLYVTLSARGLNSRLFIVSRCDDQEALTKMLQVGADRVVNPYEIGGSRMASLATQPNVADFLDVVVHDGTFEARLREILLPESCAFEGKTIDDLALRRETGAVVLSVRDGSGRFHTDDVARRPFESGDVIVAIGSDSSLDRLAAQVTC
ncbi:MAG: potassium channel protein [Acidimicrobiaceae bacterium]|nr:potassium channel protein [Acidimicrobiaceae bacterium]